MTSATWSVRPDDAARPLALALDVGTSSVRAGLFDARGRPLAGSLVRSRYRWTSAPHGSVTTDVDRLLDRIEQLLDELVTRSADLLVDVRAGGISTFVHSSCTVDADHRPTGPLRSWADTSSAVAAVALRERVDADEVWQHTGAPIHPGYWPSRIAAHRTPTRWAGLPELLFERLTGRWELGISLAAGTGLLERRSDEWWPPLLDALGLDRAQLPPIRRLPAAGRWPRLAHVPWLTPIGDGVCGNVGLGCAGPHRAALMIGTSAAMRLLLDGGMEQVPRGLFAYRTEGDRTLLGGALSEGGGLAAWWSRVSGRPLADLSAAAAARAPQRGPDALPYLTGERGLGYHGEARGMLAGLRPEHDAIDIFRALLESVVISLAAVDQRLAAALSAQPGIVASGGGVARSALWRQLVADAMARPIDFARIGEPSLRGAALLALDAIGSDVPADAVPFTTVEPDPIGVERLRDARARRDDLYRQLLG